MEEVLRYFDAWTHDDQGRYVVIRDVHGVMRARTDLALRSAHHQADLVTPDGVPLVWSAKLLGHSNIERVCGPDLLPATCARGLEKGWRHYFYGGAPGMADALADRLRARFPGIAIAGTRCPPFRSLTKTEDQEDCDAILTAEPHFVWVGLGTPKQELWMKSHKVRLPGIILLGVGAAFDIHAGQAKRAPVWMQRSGLEWFFRLASEPRRLWRRYLLLAPHYFALFGFEFLLRRNRLGLYKAPNVNSVGLSRTSKDNAER